MIKVTSATIYLTPENTPRSADFDDVYFSNSNGLQETDYVFVDGNDLIAKWESHKNSHFCIAETGFGTGLNFFRTVQHFLCFRRKHPEHKLTTLNFISTEKHPLTKTDASSLYQKWKSENFLSTNDLENSMMKQWIDQYPIAVEGLHRRHFDLEHINGVVILDLHYGDAINSFSQIQQTPGGAVDAWFLDGFAPSKNDSMWTESLYKSMAKLSKTGSSFATFTAAGAVKRGLSAAGFTVKKRKGYGRKREMLVGVFESTPIDYKIDSSSQHKLDYASHRSKIDANQAPYYIRSTMQPLDEITVVGSGLAGAMIALKLTQRGKKVKLLWKEDNVADGASGNPIGGFYPQLNAQNNQASIIQLHSFLYASEFYKSLYQQHKFDHSWCGALQLAFNDNTQTRLTKLAELNLWPYEIANVISATQASEVANIPIPYRCLYMPNAGWISPPSLVAACIQLANKTGNLTLVPNTQLLNYSVDQNSQVNLKVRRNKDLNHENIIAKTLVLALGNGCEPLVKRVIPLRSTRGQVEMVASSNSPPNNTMAKLQTLICHKGYFTPSVNGFHALGSTYIKDDQHCDIRESETNANFNMHSESMNKATWSNELELVRGNRLNYARAAIRCSTPDHLPVVGNMPSEAQFDELADLYKALPLSHYKSARHQQNVFVLTGLGSRGLTTAPLMAEILVSQMLEQPMPLSKDLLDALSPNRFIVRSLVRRQKW